VEYGGLGIDLRIVSTARSLLFTEYVDKAS